jgi:hypothetical protein
MRFHRHEPALQVIGLLLFVLRFVAPAARFICGSWVWALAISSLLTYENNLVCKRLSISELWFCSLAGLLKSLGCMLNHVYDFPAQRNHH